ncbi:hypothetical protein MMPV_003234 [Pyropia vietnamensis]
MSPVPTPAPRDDAAATAAAATAAAAAADPPRPPLSTKRRASRRLSRRFGDMFSVYDSPPATGGRSPAADGAAGERYAKTARLADDPQPPPPPPPPLSPRLSPSAVRQGGGRGARASARAWPTRSPPGSAGDGEPPAAEAGAATDARIAALQREVASLRRAAVDRVAASLEEVRSAYGAQVAALERVASAARAEAATLRELVQPAGGGKRGGRPDHPRSSTPVGEPEEAEEVGVEADAGSDDDDESPRPTVLVEEVMEEEEEVEEVVEVVPPDGDPAAALAASQAEAATLRRELADARAALAAATATPPPAGTGVDTPAAAAAAGADTAVASNGGDAAAALEVLATLVGARPVREPAADADDGGPPVWRLRVANGRTGERARGVDFRLGVPTAISSGLLRSRAGRPPAVTATTTSRAPEAGAKEGEQEEEEEDVLLEYDAVNVTVPPGVLPAYVKETAIDMPVEEAPYLFAKIVGAVFSSSAK